MAAKNARVSGSMHLPLHSKLRGSVLYGLAGKKNCNRAARAARSNEPFTTAQADRQTDRQTDNPIPVTEIPGRIFT
jgi:hypothetical protein